MKFCNYEKEIFYGLLDQYLGEKSQNSMKNKGIIDIDDVINLIFKKNTKLEKVEIPTHKINKFDTSKRKRWKWWYI